MGFVTSITPNAFVSVNDPSRWFMSSWIASHFSMQDLRNNTRPMLSAASNNNILTTNGDVSLNKISEGLRTQLTGAVQYTHGHSALVKDIVANQLAESIPDTKQRMEALIRQNTGKQHGSMGMAVFSALGMPAITVGVTAAVGILTMGAGAPAAAAATSALASGAFRTGVTAGVMALASDGVWGGWKKIRDNVLDQHGCYIQYLNKNGQPMDAGLSFNQGMVVGRYHSKKLLPGILGTRSFVRSSEGNMYIRADDIFKSFGWKEKEIGNLVRYISLENAIVHSQILKYSGIGPEKTALNEYFKSIVKVVHVKDGDTFEVEDILSSGTSNPIRYTVRFEGIDTSELAKMNVGAATGTDSFKTAIVNENSSAGKALRFVQEAVKGKLIVLRTNPKDPSMVIPVEDAYEPGSEQNRPENYAIAYKSSGQTYSEDRYMSTVFCRVSSNTYDKLYNELRGLFLRQRNNQFVQDFNETIKQDVKKMLYPESPSFVYFKQLYAALDSMSDLLEHFSATGQEDPLASGDSQLSEVEIRNFNILMNILLTNQMYQKASEWPIISWDEYYEDGSPITLNWELVINGLAKVYMDGIKYNNPRSVIGARDQIPRLVRVETNITESRESVGSGSGRVL